MGQTSLQNYDIIYLPFVFKFVYHAKAQWRKVTEPKKQSLVYTRDEKEAKRVCSAISRMIREFWQNVDRVVDFRANVSYAFIVSIKKRKLCL